MRPDFERIRRNASVIQAGAGETAQVRTWASAGAGAPQYGVEGTQAYTTRIITALFSRHTPMENKMGGGTIATSMPEVTLLEPLGVRDEIVWEGTAWRVDGAAIPTHLGGRPMYRHLLKQANA